MDTLVNILLVGAGGYGASYVKELMSITDKAVRFVAVIDPYLTDVALIECLKGRGVQVFSRIEEFRETGQSIDPRLWQARSTSLYVRYRCAKSFVSCAL